MRKQQTDSSCLSSQQPDSAPFQHQLLKLATEEFVSPPASTLLPNGSSGHPGAFSATPCCRLQQQQNRITATKKINTGTSSRAIWTARSRLRKFIAALASKAASFSNSRKDFHINNHLKLPLFHSSSYQQQSERLCQRTPPTSLAALHKPNLRAAIELQPSKRRDNICKGIWQSSECDPCSMPFQDSHHHQKHQHQKVAPRSKGPKFKVAISWTTSEYQQKTNNCEINIHIGVPAASLTSFHASQTPQQEKTNSLPQQKQKPAQQTNGVAMLMQQYSNIHQQKQRPA
ncbi:hypothetical protein Nepgr_016361 [Nepenthes gracilis]|uniref:Uncharacterized protein n=1 Tax=Nepenthes gracilis TaxID=150966 RepID=A0AAD3XSF3_NEPGR|nr:hypothetical protein Nepgr_016361 [Nepenthes gracilis]